MIALSMFVEECPFIPARPGNFWVGYVDAKEFFVDLDETDDCSNLAEKIPSVVEDDDHSIVLKNAWILGTMINTFQNRVEGRNAVNFAINQTSFVAPITEYADPNGLTMGFSLKGRSWIVLDRNTQRNIESDIEKATKRLISARSNLTLPTLS